TKIAALAPLSALDYEVKRKTVANELGMRVTALDKIVEPLRDSAPGGLLGSLQGADADGAGVEFRDYYEKGHPKPSLANAVVAIRTLKIGVCLDLVHHRITVTYKGEARTIHEGLLTDDTVGAIRSLINNTYEIDCGDNNTRAAVMEVARDNAFDPVLDLLN